MSSVRKYLYFLGGIIGVFLGFRYLLPVALPFLLGGLLALAAEPAVSLLGRRLPRPMATGIGVGATIFLLLTLIWLASALLFRQLQSALQLIPDLQSAATGSIRTAQTRLTELTANLPDGARELARQGIDTAFGSGTTMLTQLTAQLPGKLTGLVGKVSSGALGIGTGILSAFLISARLPQLRQALSRRLPPAWKTSVLPALLRARAALGGWLKAQGLLMLITFGVVSIGLLLLKVPYGILWALLVCFVDAVPLLGSGIVLLPWALIEFLRQQPVQAIGLLGTWACAMLARTIFEPRLVGKQLGIDPLLTLIFMYGGFRFLGIPGLLLAPMTAAAVKAVFSPPKPGKTP